MSLHIGQRNFDTLIVAGVGAIGSSMITLGCDVLSALKKVILVDLDAGRFVWFRNRGFSFLQGSVEDSEVLAKITDMVEGKGLLVNLCTDVDNVRIRRMPAPLDLAYVDSCAGSSRNPKKHLFSSIMEYDLTPVESRCPHASGCASPAADPLRQIGRQLLRR
ncbi:MAG: NAD-binding protein [Proteobacteria bacterium]|nr:NAD-binding protein [Pseudomonadota bacterium]MBU4295768.1 NAD-binding protein [Pseudomonadota bacterium]MCG2749075.1 NAD-binding protein [Desulfobulbaceae bacterium]